MFNEVTITDFLIILAIITGPILAVQLQNLIEAARYKKQRRLNIFHTLMATRANPIAFEHVRSLNMIDIEFYGKKRCGHQRQTASEKSITNAWKNYNDQLNTNCTAEQRPAWTEKCNTLLTTLLYKMSEALGYDFDEVQLKRDCYRPMAHGNLDEEYHNLRVLLIEVLEGKKPIPVKQFEDNNKA